MKKESMSLASISHFRKLLQLDLFETQLLMHYTRLPIETLKKRYHRARSDSSKLLITTAIDYIEAKERKR